MCRILLTNRNIRYSFLEQIDNQNNCSDAENGWAGWALAYPDLRFLEFSLIDSFLNGVSFPIIKQSITQIDFEND